MCVYLELLERAARAYDDASNGFHSAESYKKIREAVAGFGTPFERLCRIIDDERAGRYSSREAYSIAAKNELRVADAQFDVLRAAVTSAERDDAAKASRGPTNAKNAQTQRTADLDLAAQTKRIIDQARSDAEQAHSASWPGHRHPFPRMTQADLEALTISLQARAAPKEDRIVAEQLAQIGGQSAPDRRSMRGKVTA